MEKKIRLTQERVTPAMATAYLKTNLITQRHLNPSWYQTMARMMEDKQWDGLNGETIKFTMNGKGWQLVDGQNRLTAITIYNKPVDMLVLRGVPSTGFKTLDQGKNRSIENFYQIANQPHAKVCSQVAKWLYYSEFGGGNPLVWRGGARPIPGVIADWALKVHADIPEVLEPIHDYLNSFQKKGLGTKNHLAYSYYLWRQYDPLLAYDFAKYLGCGDVVTVCPTIKSLREFLLEMARNDLVKGVPGTVRGAKVLNALNTGWNAVRSGKKNVKSFSRLVSKFDKSFKGTKHGHGTGAAPATPK